MFDKNAYYREYSKRPEQRKKAYTRRKNYLKNNPERRLLWGAKQRAKEKGLAFNLIIEDIFIPEFCPILNIKLERGEGRVQKSSPVLDRIDNTKGYLKENVRVISQRANQLKSDVTVEQLKRLLEYMEKKDETHSL